MAQDKELISLKEAAKISGYSADYVGQLIRAGKLSGKQVFSSVVWMTSETAVMEYMQKEKKGKSTTATSYGLKDMVFTAEGLARAYSVVVWMIIALLLVFILFLVAVFAISVDHRINQTYQKKAFELST